MAQLQLHFLRQKGRHPIFVDDAIPTKGTSYTIHRSPKEPESFIVTLVRRQIWPKSMYDPNAKPHEYLAGGFWEVLLASEEDIASGKVHLS